MKPYQIPYRNFVMTAEDKLLKPFFEDIFKTDETIEFAMISKGICCIAFLKEGIAIYDNTKFRAKSRIRLFPYGEVVNLFQDHFFLYLRTVEEGTWKIGSVVNQLDFPLIDEANDIIERRKAVIPKRDFVRVDVPAGKIKFYKDNKTIEFPNGKIVEWSKINGVEVVTNDGEIHKTGLGRAVAGTILLGEVGLIAGAVAGKKTTKKIVYSVDLFVKVNDLSDPIVKVSLFSGKMKSDAKDYPAMVELTQKLVSMFEIIVKE